MSCTIGSFSSKKIGKVRRDLRVVRLDENGEVTHSTGLFLRCTQPFVGSVEWVDPRGNPLPYVPPFVVEDHGNLLLPNVPPLQLPLTVDPYVSTMVNWDHTICLRMTIPDAWFQYQKRGNARVRRSRKLMLDTQIQNSIRMIME